MQFGARLVSGAFSGAVIGAAGGSLVGGLIAGVIGAVIGTLGGAEVRGTPGQAFGQRSAGRPSSRMRWRSSGGAVLSLLAMTRLSTRSSSAPARPGRRWPDA